MKRAFSCLYCGKTEDAHCTGFFPQMPDNCQCDRGSWGGYVEVCPTFVGAPGQHCQTCEHDEQCHVKEPKP